MDTEYFTIRGATGIDLELPIAGPGSRSYAFVIDWHIRLLIAVALLLSAMFFMYGSLRWHPREPLAHPARAFFMALPAALVYFLYHPLIEIFMRGQTPGKRIAGVRIVNRDGGIPSVTAILIRNVFRLVDSLPAFYVVGLLIAMLSEQRLRIGDMAAGTLLVHDQKVSPALFAAGGTAHADVVAADLAASLLDRWRELAADKRAGIARALLARTGTPAPSTSSDAELKSALTTLAHGGAARPPPNS